MAHAAHPQDLVRVTSDLYEFVVAAEAALERRKETARESMVRLAARAAALRDAIRERKARATERVAAQLDDVIGSLDAMAAALRERAALETRREAWKRLSAAYEGLLSRIREARLPIPEGVRLGHVKPRNLWRNVFHVSMALFGVLLYELLLGRTAILIFGGTLLTIFIGLEILRRTSDRINDRLVNGAFSKISRPGEAHRITSATWYMAGLVAGVALFPQHAIEASVLVLGFSDPIASLVGKAWGRVKLVGDKSLVGSAAFFVTGLAAASAFLFVVRPELGALATLGIASAVALTGTLAELFSGPLDDNFTIPIAAGAVAALLL